MMDFLGYSEGSITFFGILGCMLSGALLAFTFWHPNSGRDFRIAGIISGIFICLFAIRLGSKYQWRLSVFIISLIPVELVLILAIMSGSGSYSIDTFNLQWLLGLNIFVALPWFIGAGIGKVLAQSKV